MKLFNFIVGVLGIILIVGAFSSFLQLVFLGGISTRSIVFAFGFPILLMIIGAAMTYYGFYYSKSKNKGKVDLLDIVKYGLVYTLAVLISYFIINKLNIVNNLLSIAIIAVLVSIVVQAIRSHYGYSFNMNWFVFYFLVYACVVWFMEEYVLPQISFQPGLLSSLLVGFTLAGIAIVIQKIKINRSSLPWISLILVIVLIVGNLGSLQNFTSTFSYNGHSKNVSEVSEDKQFCPTPHFPIINDPSLHLSEVSLNSKNSNLAFSTITELVNEDVWRIENNFRTCYLGRYKNQFPDRYYCDDMIVSRWDLSSTGSISYRWYTAVSAEFAPSKGTYEFIGFTCENGKKVTVNKETTAYYVHVSRDGTEIKVQY